MSPHKQHFRKLIESSPMVETYGKIHKIVGLVAEGSGISAPLGSLCTILPVKSWKELHDQDAAEHRGELGAGKEIGIPVEVVGFREGNLLFMPYGDLRGVQPGSLVRTTSSSLLFPVGENLLGRVLDAFGQDLNNKEGFVAQDYQAIFSEAPPALRRPRIREPLDIGVRAINGLLTLGKGQRVAIMAGSGVGKSTLMGMMARHTRADINVIALIGERGRELLEFIEKDLGPEGIKRSVLVVATSDQSPLIRMRAAYAATAVAEYFRDCGKDVLFMMDSVTRFAMAAREIGLAIGEPPTTKGYTPSVFAELPKLLERTGTNEHGTITGIYTVLVDGDDFNEPIADAVRSILDGHIVLTRDLADMGHFPAIDVLRSISRVRNDICPKDVIQGGRTVLSWLAHYKKVEDMVNIGAYAHGANADIDKSIEMQPQIVKFLQQGVDELGDMETSVQALLSLANS